MQGFSWNPADEDVTCVAVGELSPIHLSPDEQDLVCVAAGQEQNPDQNYRVMAVKHTKLRTGGWRSQHREYILSDGKASVVRCAGNTLVIETLLVFENKHYALGNVLTPVHSEGTRFPKFVESPEQLCCPLYNTDTSKPLIFHHNEEESSYIIINGHAV